VHPYAEYLIIKENQKQQERLINQIREQQKQLNELNSYF
jgi:hypothetical protein